MFQYLVTECGDAALQSQIGRSTLIVQVQIRLQGRQSGTDSFGIGHQVTDGAEHFQPCPCAGPQPDIR